MDLIDLIGFAGAAVMLAAYALTNARSVRVTPRTLVVMNLGAGVALALNGLVHHAWPSTVVNAVWFMIAAVALGRSAGSARGSRRGPGSDPDAALVELEHDRRSREDSRIVRGGQDGATGRRLLMSAPG